MLKKTKLANEGLDRVQSVIKEFLVQTSREELYETRIQKLIFYSEVYSVLYYKRRLTPAEYRPYMYGAFSRDVRAALDTMDDIDKRKTIVKGNRTTAYNLSVSDHLVDESSQSIISRVCNHVENESTEELAQFSKTSWLFENTDYDHPMKFQEFSEALDEHPEIRERLEDQLPKKVEDVCKDDLHPL